MKPKQKRVTDSGLIPRQRLFRVDAAAAALEVSPKTLWGWIGDRRIGVVRLGRCVRIEEKEIARLIEEGTTPAKRT